MDCRLILCNKLLSVLVQAYVSSRDVILLAYIHTQTCTCILNSFADQLMHAPSSPQGSTGGGSRSPGLNNRKNEEKSKDPTIRFWAVTICSDDAAAAWAVLLCVLCCFDVDLTSNLTLNLFSSTTFVFCQYHHTPTFIVSWYSFNSLGHPIKHYSTM